MNVDSVFSLVKYRATKAGFNNYISSGDFNLLFPRAEIRFYNSIYTPDLRSGKMPYPGIIKTSTTLSTFESDATAITIDSSGQYVLPDDFFYIDSLKFNNKPIVRVEKQDLAANLGSYYEAPTVDFPIYTEYNGYLQFYPITLGSATFNYLKKPTATKWAYTLNGSVGTLNSLVGGSGYPNGTYNNVPLTGGTGTGALATVTILGGAVTSVVISKAGFMYKTGNVLSASNTNLGGAGTGFSITVSTITNAREVYDSANSVDPQWSDTVIDSIVYIMLSDIGINAKDSELEAFAQTKINTEV